MAKNIEFYQRLKENIESVRSRYVGLWALVAQLMGLPNNLRNNQKLGGFGYSEENTMDHNTYDPAARRALDTVSDYYASLVFPTSNPFELIAPESIPDAERNIALTDWYREQSDRMLAALFNQNSGFLEVKNSFYMDWESFGTAAFGIFEQDDDNSPFVIQQFGVDNMAIQDGKNNMPEYFVLAYNWNPQVIVDYFCPLGVNDKEYGNLPGDIRTKYEQGEWNNYNLLYQIIHKNPEYDPSARIAKKSAQFIGVWIFECEQKIFRTNEYHENPMAVARFQRIRGEVYGRSDTSNFINTIVAINGIIYLVYETLGKIAKPPMAMFDNALANDDEVDFSADTLTILNSQFASAGQPIIQLQDVNNNLQFVNPLLQYLQEELQKAYKLDVIADIVQNKDMTATEFVNRLAIRGEIIGGTIMRHLSQIQPFFDRIVGICRRREGFFDIENAPDVVKDLIKSGKKWYQIKYNNAIQNILNASKIKAAMDAINFVAACAQIDTSIAPDIDLYDTLLETIKGTILINPLPSKTEHNQRKEERAKQAQQMMAADAAAQMSVANKNNAAAQAAKPLM